MNETVHLARSAEFLSSLYDGDVAPADREAFDAHRAGCAECREAASAFELTLAVFRASPTAAPAADLSARILRKIRAQSPARRPFGVMFGIDIRWAGALVAALIAILMSAPILLRRPPAGAPPAAAPPIPARILDAPAEPASAEGALARQTDTLSKDAPSRQSAPPERKVEAVPAAPPPPAAARADARAPAPAPRLEIAQAEPPGTETAAANAADAGAPASLSVSPLDGAGPAPALGSPPSARMLASLRGREFVLVVEADGHVREVQPAPQSGMLARERARLPEAAAAPSPPSPLLELRFAPGERSRRLLVRVE